MDVRDAFKFTCRMVLGREVGEMDAYEKYLSEAVVQNKARSIYSKKEVFTTFGGYCGGARFFDFSAERDKAAKALSKPIDINKVKDIDSLFGAVGEKLLYGGNKVLGNSAGVENSDNVVDSSNVLNSYQVFESRFVAYSFVVRKSDYAFGTTSSGECAATIRCFYNNNLRRSFECAYGVRSADSLFCYRIVNCDECMFTFNAQSKRHMIGNIQFEPARYAQLKSKLLEEIAGELSKRKRLPFSIVNIHNARLD
ncbi:Uncharacterised protein [uncultured archaeon]|nr:Uncharacterised protein [uncultured archaeon]